MHRDLPRTTVKQVDRISTESEPPRSIVSLFPKAPSSFLVPLKRNLYRTKPIFQSSDISRFRTVLKLVETEIVLS
ncbi:hypothetical protein BDZ91DRAFT_742507 [Kalaharituber pfeilii]|nr:hypothetical protein BDZ91DRAFT_742507 [Kalaharituber pfeilii]